MDLVLSAPAKVCPYKLTFALRDSRERISGGVRDMTMEKLRGLNSE